MAADARGGERRARPRVQRGSRLLFLLGLFDFLLRASVLGHVILPYKWIITGGAGFSLPTLACGACFFTFGGGARPRCLPRWRPPHRARRAKAQAVGVCRPRKRGVRRGP